MVNRTQLSIHSRILARTQQAVRITNNTVRNSAGPISSNEWLYRPPACYFACVGQAWPPAHVSPCLGVIHHVLQHCAKADGIVDIWLIAWVEVDALSIAAPLNVEHTILAPAVLIITWTGCRTHRCMIRGTPMPRHMLSYMPKITRIL